MKKNRNHNLSSKSAKSYIQENSNYFSEKSKNIINNNKKNYKNNKNNPKNPKNETLNNFSQINSINIENYQNLNETLDIPLKLDSNNLETDICKFVINK